MSVHAVSPRKVLTAAILSALSGMTVAGGLDLPTITAAHQGTSNANGAEASDPSVIYYNPAGLARMKPGLQISQGFSALILNGKVDVDEAGTRGTPTMDQQDGRLLATPSQPNSNGEPGSFWPRILGAGGAFVSMPLNDMVTAGVGVFAPGGANFNYKSNWPGAYQIDAIAVELLNINPSIGIRFDDQHSLGFGVSVLGGHLRQRVQIDVPGVAPYLLKSAVDTGAANPANLVPLDAALGVCSANLPIQQLVNLGCTTGYNAAGQVLVDPASTGNAKVEMYGYGFGFNAGYMFALNDSTRFGLAYRSESKLQMRGDLNWYLDNIKFNPALEGNPVGQAALTAAFGNSTLKEYLQNNLRPDTTAKGDLIIPARLSANIFHQLNQKIDLMADITFIQTSAVDKITVQFLDVQKNGKTISQGAGGVNTNWRDSYKISVGGNYRHNDKLMLRTGFQYDKTPIKSPEFRHPGAPDSDRYMFSVGANYKIKKNLSVDAAYSLVLLADSEANYRDTCRATNQENADGTYNPNGASCTSNGGTFKGRFYDTSINVLSLQLNQRF